ncbi:hypothetical protein SLEP1_g37191 [Rubroshorea leprosula]|uniref:Uncharacterized protein n=1 Tax=Rubroshorea leprosula TaxID=152421 RepID=A0AAV5KTX1_9ROSI|nr:hypothetical protein SLEP1_g37191 [Rubroshorea leprosula]
MKKRGYVTSSSDETEEPNVNQLEQPESSRSGSKRAGKRKRARTETTEDFKGKGKITAGNNYQEENMPMEIDSPNDSLVADMEIDSEKETPPERPAVKTCPPTSSTLSSGFTRSAPQSISQFVTAPVTKKPMPSTAGCAEWREATRDKQASTSCTEGTTDVLKHDKNMESCVVSLAKQLVSAIIRALIESGAVNANEESANQAKDTADDDN